MGCIKNPKEVRTLWAYSMRFFGRNYSASVKSCIAFERHSASAYAPPYLFSMKSWHSDIAGGLEVMSCASYDTISASPASRSLRLCILIRRPKPPSRD